MKKPAAIERPARGKLSYASLIRFARGPFWLGSISKLTRSPPANESKFTAESRPVRWKKYSRPSSAAIKPNPRSETNFLMVPVGISLLPSRKQCRERTGPFENFHDRGAHRLPRGRLIYLTTGARGRKKITGRPSRPPREWPPRPRVSSVQPSSRAASRRPIQPPRRRSFRAPGRRRTGGRG